MRILILITLLMFHLPAHAAEVVLSAGPLIDSNVPAGDGKARAVASVSVAKTVGRLTPYTGMETYFGDHGGHGWANPVAAKWTVGAAYRLTDRLYLVVDHYSRHAVDGRQPTEKYTAVLLRHRFAF